VPLVPVRRAIKLLTAYRKCNDPIRSDQFPPLIAFVSKPIYEIPKELQ